MWWRTCQSATVSIFICFIAVNYFICSPNHSKYVNPNSLTIWTTNTCISDGRTWTFNTVHTKSTRQHTTNRSVHFPYSQPYLPTIQHTGKKRYVISLSTKRCIKTNWCENCLLIFSAHEQEFYSRLDEKFIVWELQILNLCYIVGLTARRQ
jgi:hypothetical protein